MDEISCRDMLRGLHWLICIKYPLNDWIQARSRLSVKYVSVPFTYAEYKISVYGAPSLLYWGRSHEFLKRSFLFRIVPNSEHVK